MSNIKIMYLLLTVGILTRVDCVVSGEGLSYEPLSEAGGKEQIKPRAIKELVMIKAPHQTASTFEKFSLRSDRNNPLQALVDAYLPKAINKEIGQFVAGRRNDFELVKKGFENAKKKLVDAMLASNASPDWEIVRKKKPGQLNTYISAFLGYNEVAPQAASIPVTITGFPNSSGAFVQAAPTAIGKQLIEHAYEKVKGLTWSGLFSAVAGALPSMEGLGIGG